MPLVWGVPQDYARVFGVVSRQGAKQFSMRLCCDCLIPSHWHLCVWPRQGQGEDVFAFMLWLTLTHTRRRFESGFHPC
jgi:hypothetical protein